MPSPDTAALAWSPDTQPCAARRVAGEEEESSSSPASAGAAGSAIAASTAGRRSRGRRNMRTSSFGNGTGSSLSAAAARGNKVCRSVDSEPLSRWPDAQDPVVGGRRVAASVAVAGDHVEPAVRALDDGSQPAEAPGEQRPVAYDPAAAEHEPAQLYAAQRGEHVVTRPAGSGARHERRARGRDRGDVDAQRRDEAPGAGVGADRQRPAVVAARQHVVDLVVALGAVEAAGTVVVRDQPAGAGLPG